MVGSSELKQVDAVGDDVMIFGVRVPAESAKIGSADPGANRISGCRKGLR